MNITQAQYHQNNNINVSISVIIDGQEMSVPINTDNRHYQAIQEWVAEGNTIQEAE